MTGQSLEESFPYGELQKIDGMPTYDTLAELQSQLNANAASVSSTRGMDC